MKRKTNILKIATIFTTIAFGISGIIVHQNKVPTEVDATVHFANYDEYTYTGNYYSFVGSNDGESCEGLHGALRTTLTSNIYPDGFYTYKGSSTGQLGSVLQSVDQDPENSSNMVMFYTRDSVSKRASGDSSGDWNREHVWPQNLSNSHWGTTEAGVDILHIRPTWYDSNNFRGNMKYGDNGKANPQTWDGMLFGYGVRNGTYFEPIDSVKGDVARILMYIWTAYYDYYNDSNLLVTKAIQSYDILLQWHTMDRPDALEGHRNDYSETSKQKNRNPFVDHPEYAWKIFGNSASSSVKAACKAAYPDGSSSQITPTGITLNTNSLSLTVGGTSTLTATLQPDGASGSITWLTSNSNVATVTNGVVTATGIGTATITAKYSDSVKVTCSVTVTSSGGQGGQTGDYVKVASYIFSSVTASTTEYTTSNLLSRFNSSDQTGDGLSDIVTAVSATSKVFPAYSGSESLGIKFGTSNAGGSFTLTLSQEVVRVVVKAAGWGTSDKLKVGSADYQTPGVAYSNSNSIKTLTYDITSSNSVTFTFSTRGFIQAIDFYIEGEVVVTPTPDDYLASATEIATIRGDGSVSSTNSSRSITFSTLNLTSGTQYTSPFDGDIFTVTFGGGENDGKYYDGGTAIRTYGGGTITIAAKSGTISSITLTWDGSNKPTSASVVNVGTYSTSNNTWTGSASSVVFTRPSGSGHWRLQSIAVTCTSTTANFNYLDLRFGIKIPVTDWGAIESNLDWEIQDYGVMMFKTNSLTNAPTVQSRYEASPSYVAVGHRNNGLTPDEDGNGNYNFFVKVSIPDESEFPEHFSYATYFCVRPFVKINNQIHWLLDHDIQESVKTLAIARNNTNLTTDVLDYLSA